MRLFSGTIVLAVIAMASSHCAAQSAEQATNRFEFGREEPQRKSAREINLSKKNKHRRQERRSLKFLLEETQIIYDTQIPPEDNFNYDKETRQLQSQPCSVCGEGKEVGNPDASVSLPGQAGQIPCGTLQNMGVVGLIPPPQCDVFPKLIGTVCECKSILPTTTTGATAPATTTYTGATLVTSTEAGKAGKSMMSIPSKAGKSISTSPKAGKSTYGHGNSTSMIEVNDLNSTSLIEVDDLNSTSEVDNLFS